MMCIPCVKTIIIIAIFASLNSSHAASVDSTLADLQQSLVLLQEALQVEALKKATIAVPQVLGEIVEDEDVNSMKWVFANGRSSLLEFYINCDNKRQTINAILGWDAEIAAEKLQKIEANHYKDYDVESQVEWAKFTRVLNNAWGTVKSSVLQDVAKELQAAIQKVPEMAIAIKSTIKEFTRHNYVQAQKLWLIHVLKGTTLEGVLDDSDRLKNIVASFDEQNKKLWEELEEKIKLAVMELIDKGTEVRAKTGTINAVAALKKATIAVSKVWEALVKDEAAMQRVFDNGRSSLLRFDIDLDGKKQTINDILGWVKPIAAEKLQEIEANYYKDYDAESQVGWAEFTLALNNAWETVKRILLKDVTKELRLAINEVNSIASDIGRHRKRGTRLPDYYRAWTTEKLWLEKILKKDSDLSAKAFDPNN